MSKFELPELSRRNLLIGGGAALGLFIGWQLWPREYRANLPLAKGEYGFGSWLKIGRDGTVTIAIPQSEAGQGVYTALAQIVAGELGADWRTVAVQPALASPEFTNTLFAREWRSALMPEALGALAQEDAIDGAADDWATRNTFMITGGATSIRQFEQPCRIAGAAARTLLCQAAAERWDTAWENLETRNGFVVFGKKQLAFAELAEAASTFDLPDPVPVNPSAINALSGKEVARLDVAAKVDGSANFAGDIRLPDMLYASVRSGPAGKTRLKSIKTKGFRKRKGVVDVVRSDGWVAVLGSNWWAANQALDAIAPTFETTGIMADSAKINMALSQAFAKVKGYRIAAQGSTDAAFDKSAGTRIHKALYYCSAAVRAPLETSSATAQYRDGRLTLWMASQAPQSARMAAADAIGISVDDVTLISTFAGGSFGRNLESQIARQAAALTKHSGRPVQVVWSRPEEFMRDCVRPPAHARMTASLAAGGVMTGLAVRIAIPPFAREQMRRLAGDSPAVALDAVTGQHDPLAIAGAIPPYAIPNMTVDHYPVKLPQPGGIWRGGAHSYTAFFVESFIDELAHESGVEPLSFRMQMLVGQTRLARCLTGVAALANWDGGASGSSKGIACHSMQGSNIALIATATTSETGVKVERISAVVDCGRLINPELARQQVESGIIFGLAQALGSSTDYEDGLPTARRLRDIDLPVLSDIPEIEIEFVRNNFAPGGVSEIGVPAVAPAVANALFSAAGVRLRELPLLSKGL
jgi:isoquinoline 1-oxidoreductase beta subunit